MTNLQIGIIIVVIFGLLLMITAYIMLTRKKVVKNIKDNPVFNESFIAKLTLSNSLNKNYYNEIKNLVLSYENVSSKTLWKNEEFTLSNNDLIKINILDNTLLVYLSNNIRIDSKKIVNCGDIDTYKFVPLRLAIRNENDLDLVRNSIKDFMEINNILIKENYIRNSFIPEDKTYEQLQDENLIVPVNKNLPSEDFKEWLTENGFILTKK